MRTNEDRIELGRALINEYVQQCYGEDAQHDESEEGDNTTFIDAVADILHLAHSCGHDIEAIARISVYHVEEELEDERGFSQCE